MHEASKYVEALCYDAMLKYEMLKDQLHGSVAISISLILQTFQDATHVSHVKIKQSK